ncbi:unnamed protein product [Aphis gossypii]|uniref:Uncharacterized protein n=1 Tax=Aphis gossypii TaxID=80765 RepID=A0A9P0JLY4_APHGO|nr:unnamed protein product [Aphis gossypii]
MDHIRRFYDRINCHIKNTSKNFQDRLDRPAGSYKIDNIGDYPCEYNPKVHGPYNPARFYGTPDTSFSQLKLCEVTDWVKRRNKSPKSIVGLFSRAYWRWSHQYVGTTETFNSSTVNSLHCRYDVNILHDELWKNYS